MQPEPMQPEFEPFGWITPSANGSFSFAEPGDGLHVKLLQVNGFDGELLDVVAWRFGNPSPWWLWRRDVIWLGLHELWRAGLRSPRRPVRLVATPADWLVDAGHALCILNWSLPVAPLVDLAGEIVCASPSLERHLRDKLVAESIGRVRSRRAAA